jgi:hypothetical protein
MKEYLAEQGRRTNPMTLMRLKRSLQEKIKRDNNLQKIP